MEDSEVILTEDDFREALRELGVYVDITERDLKKIYELSARIAKERCAHSWLAREIMTRDVITIKEDTDLYEAGKTLIKNRISGMPVVNGEGRVIGIITNADVLTMAEMPRGHVFNDVVMKYVLNKPTPQHRKGSKVRDIMSKAVITVSPETTVRKIAEILDKKRIKRVPVIDEENKLVGIVSRGDIVRVVCEESERKS